LARLLALSLRDAGRYREALGWVEKVLAAGVGGPRLGMAIMVQVELTRKTGELLERVLAIEATVYGSKEHYSTAITETNLGLLLVDLGEIEKGLGRMTHAYGVFQRQLGDEHPSTRQVAELIQETSANRSESETSE
jgi:hypothetical protein